MNPTRGLGEAPAAAALMKRMSADRFGAFFWDGLLALAAGRTEPPPFGSVYAHLQSGQDITEDLAAAYGFLPSRGQRAFQSGLEAAVRRLSLGNAFDRKALLTALRLAARIDFYDLLPMVTRKAFGAAPALSEDLIDVGAQVIDAAVELASGSPNALDGLRDIVDSATFQSGAFSSKAPTLLLALTDAKPPLLIDHLHRLEGPLAAHYGANHTPRDEGQAVNRALLLTDLYDSATTSIMGGVIDFALLHRDWRLAWLGEILLDPTPIDLLPPDDADKARLLLDRLLEGSNPAEAPEWVRLKAQPRVSITEHRGAADILDDDIEGEEQDRIYKAVIADLTPAHSARFGAEVMKDEEIYE